MPKATPAAVRLRKSGGNPGSPGMARASGLRFRQKKEEGTKDKWESKGHMRSSGYDSEWVERQNEYDRIRHAQERKGKR